LNRQFHPGIKGLKVLPGHEYLSGNRQSGADNGVQAIPRPQGMGEEGEKVDNRLRVCKVGGTLGEQEYKVLVPILPGPVNNALTGDPDVHERAEPVQDLFKRCGQVMKINRRSEYQHIGFKDFQAQRFPVVAFYGAPLYKVTPETTPAALHIAAVGKNFMITGTPVPGAPEKFPQQMRTVAVLPGTAMKR